MTINGKCYCGAIHWHVVGAVDFTSVCHCRDCQCISGSAYGSTSLVIYDPKGVEFSGDIKPKVYHAKSEAGRHTQRGFCPECGTVLFNHVSEGEEDEHWAMRTGSMADSRALRMDKEIFMKSKLSWVPIVTKPDSHYIGMPKRKNKGPQTTIDETLNEGEQLKGKVPAEDDAENGEPGKEGQGQTTIEQSLNGKATGSKGTGRNRKRKKTS
ncbi:hypothetical protein LTR13_010997 [Exophiala sideris]|nr:hypothetical protein LTR13_010997 [Exophiala sideris]KAK5186735.1 hypothetical protein LTR44_000741 [Eurotiomycetes sp. CCFEE 6388]